jgi:membrane-associated phospholipid phosphatase
MMTTPAGPPAALRRFRLAGLVFNLTDIATLGGIAVFTVLAIVFHGRIARPDTVIGVNLVFIAVYIAAVAVLPRIRRPGLRFLIRTATVQFTFLQIYKAANELQLVFFPWQDDLVLAGEQALLGFQPLVAIQKLYTPPLSEWMFFVYAVYVVIYPALGAIIFFKRGEEANEDYLFRLGLVNFVCGAGFVLFPVASPMYWPKVRALLTEPLTAGFFGSVAEWIRANVHQPGGSVPSPHCAVATVMWFTSLKYTRHGFLWLAPIILSLYVSTVYGRFHYVSDMAAGIAAGLAVILVAPWIERAWNGPAARVPEGAS